ncbi:MAG: hypothetical protein M3M96_07755 [Candidatus Eremiobacteraeota bacterium]|nr:hypothetical protein [Candidatus Eremiobacteraeota bacterium]
MRRIEFLAPVVAALLLFAAAPAFADCRLHSGDHVILYGTADDPDVFVWDSRFRMRSYQGGSWDQAQALLPHALLAPPGTRAAVAGCVSNFVQSKYAALPDDAVGVVILSGPLKGKLGWVIGADTRRIYHK